MSSRRLLDMASTKSDSVFEDKVLSQGIGPDLERWAMPASISFYRFYELVQVMMGLIDVHLNTLKVAELTPDQNNWRRFGAVDPRRLRASATQTALRLPKDK